MDERLKLAEHYYATAAHLREQGEYYIRMAETLAHIADAMCENKPASYIAQNVPVSATAPISPTGD